MAVPYSHHRCCGARGARCDLPRVEVPGGLSDVVKIAAAHIPTNLGTLLAVPAMRLAPYLAPGVADAGGIPWNASTSLSMVVLVLMGNAYNDLMDAENDARHPSKRTRYFPRLVERLQTEGISWRDSHTRRWWGVSIFLVSTLAACGAVASAAEEDAALGGGANEDHQKFLALLMGVWLFNVFFYSSCAKHVAWWCKNGTVAATAGAFTMWVCWTPVRYRATPAIPAFDMGVCVLGAAVAASVKLGAELVKDIDDAEADRLTGVVTFANRYGRWRVS